MHTGNGSNSCRRTIKLRLQQFAVALMEQSFRKLEDTKDRVKTSETRLFRALSMGREKLLMTARLRGAKQMTGLLSCGKTFRNATTFLYLPDEPGPSQYKYIRQLADNIHSNPGPGKALPTFVTKHYVKELDGAIDIWDTGPLGYDIKRAAEERARGRKYWIYNGGRPAAGAIVIDAPATDARATIWACFKHGIDNYFFWHGVHWQHNRQKVGERKQNVWANPITFDNRGQPNKPIDDQGYINGDGVLMYPGEDKLHPDQDRGIAGPISTIQLANLRRGLQDHQYLTLARKLKLDSLVDEVLQSVVPRVFSDSGPAVGFSEAGNDYERARYKLAQAIAKRSTK